MTVNDIIPQIWLAIALVGLTLAIVSLFESVSDFRSTRPTNGFRMLAIGDLAQESIRTALYVLFAALGIYYIAIEQPVARTGVGWLMVGAEILLVAKTVIQLVVRRYLRTHTMIEVGPETQDQREDRVFGQQRRRLEDEHNDAREEENQDA